MSDTPAMLGMPPTCNTWRVLRIEDGMRFPVEGDWEHHEFDAAYAFAQTLCAQHPDREYEVRRGRAYLN